MLKSGMVTCRRIATVNGGGEVGAGATTDATGCGTGVVLLSLGGVARWLSSADSGPAVAG